MRLGERLISNTVYLFLDWFVIALFSLFFWMVVGKTLSPSDVGIVATSNNFAILVAGLAVIGLDIALKKLLPEIIQKKEIEHAYSLIRACVRPLLISIFTIFLVLIIFSNQLSSFLKIPSNAFLITVFTVIAIAVYNFLGAALYGFQKMRRFFITDFMQGIVKVVLSTVLVVLGFSYFGPLIGFFIGYILISFFRFSTNYLKKKKALSDSRLFEYAIPALIVMVMGSLIFNGQYIILTVLKNTEITGIFAIAFTITSTIGIITQIPSTALFPVISALSVDHNTKKKQGYLIGLVLRYSLILIVPLSLILLLFSKTAVLLFAKPEFLPATYFFPLLIPAGLLYGVGTIFSVNIYAIGKPKTYRNIMIMTSSLFLVTSLILTNYFSALGLSVSYLITQIIFFSLSFIYIRKYLEIKIFTNDIMKILVSSLITISILFIIRPFIYNFIMLGLFLIPVSIFYLYLLLFTRFYRTEDIKIIEFFADKMTFIRRPLLRLSKIISESDHSQD